MHAEAFALLRQAETSWWYRGRIAIAERLVGRLASRPTGPVLDFGAGFGGMGDALKTYGELVAVEPNADAADVCRTRGYGRVVASLTDLDAEAGRFGLIAAMDVLEHVPDDAATLQAFHRLLRPGGALILNVPAYQWLWSEHDREHEHYRRYTRSQLKGLLSHHGFRVVRATYWNAILFLPMLVLRRLGMSGEGTLRGPVWMQTLIGLVMRVESAWVARLTFPFGSSVMTVALKENA